MAPLARFLVNDEHQVVALSRDDRVRPCPDDRVHVSDRVPGPGHGAGHGSRNGKPNVSHVSPPLGGTRDTVAGEDRGPRRHIRPR